MQRSLICLLFIAVILVSPACAYSAIHLAQGDSLTFAPPTLDNTSSECRVWIFDQSTRFFTSMQNPSWISIPYKEITNLIPGDYTLYIQHPGKNGRFDIGYINDTYTVIYKSIPDINVYGKTSDVKKTELDNLKSNTLLDDTFDEYKLYVEYPEVTATNMYTKDRSGAYHIDFTTNLAVGERITSMIDEEIFKGTPYQNLMSNSSVVSNYGGDNTFWLEFPIDAANQLTSGTHVISVRYLDRGLTAIPFKRSTAAIEPTPTPEIVHYYDFNGNELGYRVNTTKPYEPIPTVEIKVTPTPATVLAEIHINNRSIEQRGNVYIGEKNLDVWSTLGWESDSGDFQVKYCDGDDTIVTITNPHHFNVDFDTYGHRLGAWCQYQDNIDEDRAPIAFMVRSPYGVNLTDPYFVPPPKITSNVTSVNGSVIEASPSMTVAETTATPTPIPTTEAIVVPLPWWIAVIAIAGVVAWKR